MKAPRFVSIVFLLAIPSLFAQPLVTHHTQLIVPVAQSTVVPSGEGPSRVRVPPGEKVTLHVPDWAPEATAWRRNGKVIPGAAGRTYTIESASSAHAGHYTFDGLPLAPTHFASGVLLDVVPTGHFANLSARLKLEGDSPQIVGFYVSGAQAKNILFRVTGPSLAQFGLQDFAPKPRITPYNSNGEHIGGGGRGGPPIDWPRTFAVVGAFPLTGDEAAGTAYELGFFLPGAYTLHVHDAAKVGGTVLVEVYEVPGQAVYVDLTPPAE